MQVNQLDKKMLDALADLVDVRGSDAFSEESTAFSISLARVARMHDVDQDDLDEAFCEFGYSKPWT